MDQSSLKKIFLESFDTYNDALFRFCIVKTSNKELAEDLTQETFTRYWLALKEGKTMTNTRSFLYTIANHLVIDWYRRKKPSSLDALASEGFQPQETHGLNAAETAEFSNALSVLDGLEEKDKEVILLRYIEGLEPRDIAEQIGESSNLVSVRLSRALEKLQKKLRV